MKRFIRDNPKTMINQDDFMYPVGFVYCPECGEKLIVKTDKCICGQEKTNYSYCPFCGIKN